MLLFNLTAIIEENAATDWLQWMKATHVPQLMAKECFVSYRILQIVDSPNEGLSYCVQFIAENETKQQEFRSLHEQQFTSDIYAKYPNKVVIFSTLMEFVG